jgi:hypothetical protein
MSRSQPGAVLAGLAALALAVSAVGPCHCFLGAGPCHEPTREADAHACCEKPAGVQAVADGCCDDAPELILAAPDVPQVAPPAPQGVRGVTFVAAERAVSVGPAHAPPPHPPDRTTVLLI